jgi:hypothetical protein
MRFFRTAVLVSAVVVASLAGGSARAEHGVPFGAANGYTYVWDQHHCLYLWTTAGWQSQGCRNAAQIAQYNAAILAQRQAQQCPVGYNCLNIPGDPVANWAMSQYRR